MAEDGTHDIATLTKDQVEDIIAKLANAVFLRCDTPSVPGHPHAYAYAIKNTHTEEHSHVNTLEVRFASGPGERDKRLAQELLKTPDLHDLAMNANKSAVFFFDEIKKQDDEWSSFMWSRPRAR